MNDLSRIYRLYHKIPQGLELAFSIFIQVNWFIIQKEHLLYDHFDLLKLLRISMVQRVTDEGLALVNQIINAVNNQV